MSWSRRQGPRGYHHGNLKEALIRAALELIAKKGPAGFTFAEAARWDGGRPEPLAAFERLGKAYLEFARAEPAYYSAMFEAGVPHDISPELTAAGDRAFAVLRTASETLIARMPAGRRPPAMMVALHIWSLSHGIASLFGRGDEGRRTLPMKPEELLEAGVLVYLRGLGLAEGGQPTTS